MHLITRASQFVLRRLVQKVVDLQHRLDLIFRRQKSLADQRVVKLMRRRIVSVPCGVARDRRLRALCGEIGHLQRRALLREDGELLVGRSFRRMSVARGVGQVRQRRPMTISTRRIRDRRDSWQQNARTTVRGSLGRRDLPDRKTRQQKKKSLVCVF
jgi:hypothetical protein